MTALVAFALACYLVGFLLLGRGGQNLAGSDLRAFAGILGALLVSTGIWTTLLACYLVGTR
jgi:hypothetical protein